MNKIFSYIELAVGLLTVVPTLVTLFTLKQKITGVQVQADIAPALDSLSAILPQFNPNPAIVLDFCNAFADTFNQYVAGAVAGTVTPSSTAKIPA
jgi:hypothetical protein